MPSSTSSPTPRAADVGVVAPAPRRFFWLWVALESLVAFALSMHHISARSIWYDEGFSTVIGASTWGEIARVARTADPNMTGYHAVLHPWLDLFGTSEAAVRSLSAVSVAIAVFVVVALTRRLRDERTALLAGLVFAVAPLAVRYGQEARSYGLEMLMLTAATYCFFRLVAPPVLRQPADPRGPAPDPVVTERRVGLRTSRPSRGPRDESTAVPIASGSWAIPTRATSSSTAARARSLGSSSSWISRATTARAAEKSPFR